MVEDEPAFAAHVTKRLEDLGHQVLHVSTTGEEAVEKVPQLRPDLVLMDVELGGDLDGVQASNLILNTYEVPILFTTARREDEIVARIQRVSTYGYLYKPFDAEALRVNITKALQEFANHSRQQFPIQHEAIALANYLALEEAERFQMSHALHERIGQLLSAAKLHFESLEVSEQTRGQYEEGKQLLSQAIKQVRRLSRQLLPNLLRDFGLEAAITAYLKELHDEHPAVPIKLEINRLDQRLPTNIAYGLYRMVQDSLAFFLGLPCTTRINLQVHDGDGIVHLHLYLRSISDDSPTMAYMHEEPGFKALDGRAQLMGADMLLEKNLPGWVHLQISVPLAPAV